MGPARRCSQEEVLKVEGTMPDVLMGCMNDHGFFEYITFIQTGRGNVPYCQLARILEDDEPLREDSLMHCLFCDEDRKCRYFEMKRFMKPINLGDYTTEVPFETTRAELKPKHI